MKFICIDDAIDSGDRQHLSKRETPITHNYRRERIYDIDEAQLRRLTAIGLFPEVFEYGDEAAAAWVEAHNDELCDIVDARVLPYRKLTAEEEANDRLVAKTGEGKFTLPHGVVAISRPKLIRRGTTVAKTSEEGTAQPVNRPDHPDAARADGGSSGAARSRSQEGHPQAHERRGQKGRRRAAGCGPGQEESQQQGPGGGVGRTWPRRP